VPYYVKIKNHFFYEKVLTYKFSCGILLLALKVTEC